MQDTIAFELDRRRLAVSRDPDLLEAGDVVEAMSRRVLSDPDSAVPFRLQGFGRAAWEDETVSANEKFEVFRTQLDTAQAPPTVATWEQVAAKFDAQIEEVCKNDLAPADALATVQSEAQGIGTGA